MPVSAEGLVDPDDVRRAIRPNTALISIMHVNNEIGTIQPIREIAAIAQRSRRPYALGRRPGGRANPRGCWRTRRGSVLRSALTRCEDQRVSERCSCERQCSDSLLFGGRHEAGRRPGTENTPGIAAMGSGAACANATASDMDRIAASPRSFGAGNSRSCSRCTQSMAPERPACRIRLTLCFEGIEGESLVIALDLRGFCVSSGSACSSGAVEPSHVLLALGLSEAAREEQRPILTRTRNTAEQVDELIDGSGGSCVLTCGACRLRTLPCLRTCLQSR